MKSKTVIFIFVLFVSTATLMIWHIKTLQTNITHSTALQNAKLIAVATLDVINMNSSRMNEPTLEDHGLTFGKIIGEKISNGTTLSVYSPHPFPGHRDSGGLNNPFRTQAWTQLSALPQQAFYQFENLNHQQLLRYAFAVPMISACIDCHNNHKQTPRNDWKSGDLSGIIEINLPVTKILPKENENLRVTVIAYSGVMFCCFIGIILMIIKQKFFNDQLTRLTATDPLTGLYNQRELFTSLKRETDKVKRGSNPLCLMYFDIDGFKQINDTLGHLKGDEVLRYIGDILPGLIRTFDIPCRFTGDEFAILLPGCSTSAATQIGQRIIESLHLKYPQVQLSIGIAQSDSDSYRDSDQLLKQAVMNKGIAKENPGEKIVVSASAEKN